MAENVYWARLPHDKEYHAAITLGGDFVAVERLFPNKYSVVQYEVFSSDIQDGVLNISDARRIYVVDDLELEVYRRSFAAKPKPLTPQPQRSVYQMKLFERISFPR